MNIDENPNCRDRNHRGEITGFKDCLLINCITFES
jgi:hypothetical protein